MLKLVFNQPRVDRCWLGIENNLYITILRHPVKDIILVKGVHLTPFSIPLGMQQHPSRNLYPYGMPVVYFVCLNTPIREYVEGWGSFLFQHWVRATCTIFHHSIAMEYWQSFVHPISFAYVLRQILSL